jgi:hypothetical protein
VTNTGGRAGDEVVQLYVSHPGAAAPRPIRELKGYQRISLQPGERKTVTFPLDAAPQTLRVCETLRVSAGVVEVQVGSSSQHLPLAGRFEIVGS